MERMRVRPVSPDALIGELSGRIAAAAAALPPARRLRVAVDGAPAAEPETLADALIDPLKVAGVPVLRVRGDDFLRPASVQLEYGRTNPDSYYEGWLDEAGLRREVLDPLGATGPGAVRVLPSLWNARTDRASRADYVSVPPGGVVVVSGVFLLGGVLPFDLTTHLLLSSAALRRRTPPGLAWTLPAFDRYAAEVAPQTFADVVVKLDDPRHPALIQADDPPAP